MKKFACGFWGSAFILCRKRTSFWVEMTGKSALTNRDLWSAKLCFRVSPVHPAEMQVSVLRALWHATTVMMYVVPLLPSDCHRMDCRQTSPLLLLRVRVKPSANLQECWNYLILLVNIVTAIMLSLMSTWFNLELSVLLLVCVRWGLYEVLTWTFLTLAMVF